jgi:hypothetical protein
VKLFLPAMLLISCYASANVAVQTDWSGGPGYHDPFVYWSNCFAMSSSVEWLDYGGLIRTALQCDEHIVSDWFDGAALVATRDVDEDGDCDVLGASWPGYNEDCRLSWFENQDGLGTSWTEHQIRAGVSSVISGIDMADIDGDGDLDAIYSDDNYNGMTEDLAWCENADGAGTSWVMHEIADAYSIADGTFAGDIDGDGAIDVAGMSGGAAGSIDWWENVSGTGLSWVEHSVDAGYVWAYSMCSCNLDGDSSLDILATTTSSGGQITWWDNSGNGLSWTEHLVEGAFPGTRRVASADIDGDGSDDVLCAGVSSMAWWRNVDGAGNVWAKSDIASVPDELSGAGSADLDMDGDNDVFAAAEYSTRWWENLDGSGTSWALHVIDDNCVDARGIASGDIDGDPGMDLVGSEGSDFIEWWDLDQPPCYQDTSFLESSVLYAGGDPDYGALSWTPLCPAGTAVAFQVRASDDPEQMGIWSSPITSFPASLHGLLADNASCFQYKAILTTTDPDTTPELLDVTLTWNLLGIGGGDCPSGFELRVAPNPCHGAPEVELGIPAAGNLELSVFDISGRLVQFSGPAGYQSGWYAIQLDELGPGVYFIRMRAGECEATKRFVVIE